MTEQSQFDTGPEPAAVSTLRASGFEHLEGMAWHRPGGTAAEITRHGEIRLTIVRHGISIQAGPIKASGFVDALSVLDTASDSIGGSK